MMETLRQKPVVWIAIGAVLAVFATMMVSEAWRADAAPGDSDSTFVPTAGCRLADTRPAPNTVGPRSTPLGAGQTFEVTVHGSNGNCTGALAIPSDAVGVALNVTAVGATERSNIRLYPANLTTVPTLSNLNVTAGAPATPNKVDVQLSPDGKLKVYNNRGSVNVFLDVVGYYSNASLKSLAQQTGPAGPPGPQGDPGPANLVPFNLRLDAGDTVTIGTAGALSLEADCADLGGGVTRVRVLGKTTVNDGVVMSGDDAFNGAANNFLQDVTPADDREMLLISNIGTLVVWRIDRGAIMNRSGDYLAIDAETTLLGVDYDGRDCTLTGSYTFQEAPV